MSVRAPSVTFALLAVLPALAGCISLSMRYANAESAIASEELEQVGQPGRDLQDVLDRFGAPFDVWETARGGLALAYGWYESRSFGASVSVPVWESVSASLNADSAVGRMRGVVFFYDRDLAPAGWRTGALRDLRQADGRRRPSLPED